MENSSYDLVIRAGNGGRESVAWAGMLTRMYIFWLEKHDYEHNADWPDHDGSETFRIRIKDPDACVRLQAEVGMHRLVRVSPFDAESRRHTSFAAVSLETVPSSRFSVLRSYVFEPYQLVKDHHTGLEVTSVQSVLDGNIDQFVDAQAADAKHKIRKIRCPHCRGVNTVDVERELADHLTGPAGCKVERPKDIVVTCQYCPGRIYMNICRREDASDAN